MVRIEDIVFWILVLVVAAILIWLLFGSPSFEEIAIPIGLFIIGSEILLWKALFQVDKKTAIGFEKARNDLDNKHKEIKTDLEDIKKLIKK